MNAKNVFETFVKQAGKSYNSQMPTAEMKGLVRKVADEDESFKDTVFELGVAVLAKRHGRLFCKMDIKSGESKR